MGWIGAHCFTGPGDWQDARLAANAGQPCTRVRLCYAAGMSKRFTILLAGDLTVTDRLKAQVEGSRLIAADGGMAHAAALCMVPELWIGDFDSSDARLMAQYPDVPRQTHPPAKDTTDGELAIQEVMAMGAGEIVLAGGLGGQMDHAFAHLMLLLKGCVKVHAKRPTGRRGIVGITEISSKPHVPAFGIRSGGRKCFASHCGKVVSEVH